MSEPVWEDPPGVKSGKAAQAKYAPIAEKLKAKPGAWARIGTFERFTLAKTICNAARRGRGGFEPAGAFEATQRRIKDEQTGERVTRVWIRYVGGDAS